MDLAQLSTRFSDQGFLILERFFSVTQVDRLRAAVQTELAHGDGSLVIDDAKSKKRTLLGLCDDLSHGRVKYNDLFLASETLRDLALAPRLAAVLNRLLGEQVVLVNSLNFEKGSTQGGHIDSLYMTPQTRGALCATWIALEDVSADAGPLFYYPGSHRFEPFCFADGSFHANEPEMTGWRKHMDSEIARLGVVPVEFMAQKGDVFVWHADLLHGGRPINDPTLSRHSMVCHYYTETDCRAIGWGDSLVAKNGACWLRRSPQPVQVSGTDWLDRMPFPEQRYLERNPDVQEAIDAGQFTSALDHYRRFGHQEQRWL